MSALIVGCLAASGGAMVGFLFGALLASSRSQDMEIAYRRLRFAVEQLLADPALAPLRSPLSDALRISLREALREADASAYPECVPNEPTLR